MSDKEKQEYLYEDEETYERRQEQQNKQEFRDSNDNDKGIGCGHIGSIIGGIITVVLILARCAAASSGGGSSHTYSVPSYSVPSFEYVKESIPEDPKEAFKYYLEKAKEGDKVHQYNVGVCYATGEGTEVDTHEAFRWYKKAAEQGVAEAQYNVGVTYWNGEIVRRNVDEAKKWFEKAARNGNSEAQKVMREEFGETISASPRFNSPYGTNYSRPQISTEEFIKQAKENIESVRRLMEDTNNTHTEDYE